MFLIIISCSSIYKTFLDLTVHHIIVPRVYSTRNPAESHFLHHASHNLFLCKNEFNLHQKCVHYATILTTTCIIVEVVIDIVFIASHIFPITISLSKMMLQLLAASLLLISHVESLRQGTSQSLVS